MEGPLHTWAHRDAGSRGIEVSVIKDFFLKKVTRYE